MILDNLHRPWATLVGHGIDYGWSWCQLDHGQPWVAILQKHGRPWLTMVYDLGLPW